MTSLRQHESDVLLCVETTHKVLRLDTVLFTIRSIEQNCRGDQIGEVQKQLKDTIVLTAYNRKTYRINDVVYKLNPSCTFETKAGEL